MTQYQEFQARLKLLFSKNPKWIENTLSNIFTMRLVGNKTHGDLAEIAIAEFINQFMYDYKSVHVGKDLFRAKSSEEDVMIINELTGEKLPLSLKAYGHGPLQLSTDKNSLLFKYLETLNLSSTGDIAEITQILTSDAFASQNNINVMPLIYEEKSNKCNITVFDFKIAKSKVAKIEKKTSNSEKTKGKKRLHPVYVFFDSENNYIFEVRYGDKTANALQRGLWTNTKNAEKHFISLTSGWINYAHNLDLVKLIALALNSRQNSHREANKILQDDITNFKNNA